MHPAQYNYWLYFVFAFHAPRILYLSCRLSGTIFAHFYQLWSWEYLLTSLDFRHLEFSYIMSQMIITNTIHSRALILISTANFRRTLLETIWISVHTFWSSSAPCSLLTKTVPQHNHSISCIIRETKIGRSGHSKSPNLEISLLCEKFLEWIRHHDDSETAQLGNSCLLGIWRSEN